MHQQCKVRKGPVAIYWTVDDGVVRRSGADVRPRFVVSRRVLRDPSRSMLMTELVLVLCCRIGHLGSATRRVLEFFQQCADQNTMTKDLWNSPMCINYSEPSMGADQKSRRANMRL